MTRRGEAGEGKLGCIFWMAVLVLGIVVAWIAIPVKVKSAELFDYMQDQAQAATHIDNSEVLKKRILGKAKDLDLPLTSKNLTVNRTAERIQMDALYIVPLEFPFGYTYEWEFHHEVDRPLYFY
ncbi:MAG TPA: hypothetical protein VHQ65_01930 [Thermoanaerobaculia bacterium]|nr:hypothetical protein [Thermoanaerobaculia bacterium]